MATLGDKIRMREEQNELNKLKNEEYERQQKREKINKNRKIVIKYLDDLKIQIEKDVNSSYSSLQYYPEDKYSPIKDIIGFPYYGEIDWKEYAEHWDEFVSWLTENELCIYSYNYEYGPSSEAGPGPSYKILKVNYLKKDENK